MANGACQVRKAASRGCSHRAAHRKKKKHSLSSAASGTDRSDNTVTQKSAQADSAIHLDFTRVLGGMHRCSLELHRLLFARD